MHLYNNFGMKKGGQVTKPIILVKICYKLLWAHERAPLNSQWLVLRIGGADFLYCWVANSIWLERAESLITK